MRNAYNAKTNRVSVNYNHIVLISFLFEFFRKDVRLPVQLQRAMAAEAEAAREARAKVSLEDKKRNESSMISRKKC